MWTGLVEELRDGGGVKSMDWLEQAFPEAIGGIIAAAILALVVWFKSAFRHRLVIVRAKVRGFPTGVVPRSALSAKSRLKGEVFAAELLARDIVIHKHKAVSDNHTIVRIDRSGITDAVISTAGKKALCKQYVAPSQQSLRKKDQEYHEFLVKSSLASSKVVALQNLPLRWASGGVISVVRYRSKMWIPLFFRDIRPYGWNISLGSSERYFDEKGKIISDFDQELVRPSQLIYREFLEEMLVLKQAPSPGENVARPFVVPFAQWPQSQQKKIQFENNHIRLREEYDQLRIVPNQEVNIHTHARHTAMTLDLINDNKNSSSITDVIICFNLLELGVEVVKVVTYHLDDKNYMLDGEILESSPKELIRMPIALISCSYLRSVFSGQLAELNYTLGPEPSIRVEKAIPPEDIYIFDWDLLQRVAVIRGDKKPVGTELDRYMDWYDKFGAYFLNGDDYPSNRNASRLFTPATAKLLNLYFTQVAPEVFTKDG
jgi:hypothetical protein